VTERPWPHRNAAEHIADRQARLKALPGWDSQNDVLFEPPLGAYAPLVESLTAHVTLPVSVVGPLHVELGHYTLDRLPTEISRQPDTLYVPLAHSEGGLAASLQRGMLAVADARTAVRTHLLQDRVTRASCFLFASTSEAVTFARWLGANVETLRDWLHAPDNPLYAQRVDDVPRLSRHARLWEVDSHVVGTACHVLYRFSTGDACGPNMVTRNAFALNTRLVAPRFASESGIEPRRVLVEANMGGDKKPSAAYFSNGGHGKTVIAEAELPERTLRGVLRTSSVDLVELSHLATHGSIASGMPSVAFSPASIVAAIFAATGQDLGMVGTSSMAHTVLAPAADGDGVHVSIRFAGIEVGTIGGGTGMPHARAFLSLLGCAADASGGAQRLAQIVAASALCLEVSAAAAAATPFSASFAEAHLRASGRTG
jgi:hydroxymethylglutaryl-CoA reductase (NADPH)